MERKTSRISTALCEARCPQKTHQTSKSKNCTSFVVASKHYKAPLCNLSWHLKSSFDALVFCITPWGDLCCCGIMNITTFNANNGVYAIITLRPQEVRSLPQCQTTAPRSVKKIQKHSIPCAVLSHWSSFSWILGLGTLGHSLAGDDGAHLWLENGTAQIRKAAGLMSGKGSKPKLGLEATFLSLM